MRVMNNFETLVREVLKRSRSKNYIFAFQEWQEVRTYKIDEEEGKETCLCGKHPISEVFVLSNIYTGEEIIIGNVCIRRFKDGEVLEKLFTDYKKVRRDINKRLSQSTIDYMRDKKVPGFQSYNFYSSRRGRKIITLRETELSLIIKVNKMFIEHMERRIAITI